MPRYFNTSLIGTRVLISFSIGGGGTYADGRQGIVALEKAAISPLEVL